MYWYFLKGINLKLNVIARLEFKLTNYDVTVSNVNRYSRELPLSSMRRCLKNAIGTNAGYINIDVFFVYEKSKNSFFFISISK